MSALFAIKGKKLGRISVLAYLSSSILNRFHDSDLIGNETVYLSHVQMCELFDKNKRTISEHIRNIFREGELQEEQVVWKFRITAGDGKSYLWE